MQQIIVKYGNMQPKARFSFKYDLKIAWHETEARDYGIETNTNVVPMFG